MEVPANADRYAHPLVPAYAPELFRGTAEYYARFRPRYPAALLDAIQRTVGLDHGDALLDLACGTGEVALAFADRVTEMWAVDLEPEMVAVGRAFHRLNRPLIAQRSIRWLRSGGHFIDMGGDTSGLFEPSEPWLAAATEVYKRWLPRAHKSRDDVTSSSASDQPKATSQAVLARAGFTQVAKHQFPVPHVWEIDQFIGYLCSTSYSSQGFWGDAWAGFALDLRNTLAALAPTGLLTETISAYFVVGRKP